MKLYLVTHFLQQLWSLIFLMENLSSSILSYFICNFWPNFSLFTFIEWKSSVSDRYVKLIILYNYTRTKLNRYFQVTATASAWMREITPMILLPLFVQKHLKPQTYAYTNRCLYQQMLIPTYVYTNRCLYQQMLIPTYAYTNICLYQQMLIPTYDYTNIMLIPTYDYTNIMIIPT